MMGRQRALLGLVMVPLLGMLTGAGDQGVPVTVRDAASPQAATTSVSEAAAYERLPLAFEPNVGQATAGTDFVAHGPGYTVALQGGSAALVIATGDSVSLGADPLPSGAANAVPSQEGTGQRVVDLALVGVGPRPVGRGQQALPGVASYLVGNDPSLWHANIPTYAKVQYADVYPGVAIEYFGRKGQLEDDFVVAPGADPNQIGFAVRGADTVTPTPDGALQIALGGGVLRLEPPELYQDLPAGRVQVAGAYRRNADGTTGFSVGNHDASRPLIIDPVLAYSTYLGGSGNDFGNGIALDSSGDAYVTGSTNSPNFPTTPGAFQSTVRGHPNVFVAKLNASGTALVYSTYLGGTGSDFGNGIAVDGTGDAYVAGQTNSTNFPTTPGAVQPTYRGDIYGNTGDAFVAELNPSGTALVYSTYFGGSGSDVGAAIAVDGAGAAYVTGWTNSADLTTTPGAVQPTFLGGPATSLLGPCPNTPCSDAFVVKLNPGGTGLAYSTYLGGTGGDSAASIALDSGGDAYVAGQTTSADFPTTPGAVQPTYIGGTCNYGYCPDAFVTKLNPAGTALLYSTYLGGNGSDFGSAIAVDRSGDAYVTGSTTSTNFPTTPGAFQPTANGGVFIFLGDAFVAKLNPAGTALLFSTYLGGSGGDGGAGIAVDGLGNVYVTGGTASADFPTTPGAVQSTYRGGPATRWGPCPFDPCTNAFVVKLNPSGTAVAYSTYLGGTGNDAGTGIAVDGAGAVYLSGQTSSADFPTTTGAPFGGFTDAFVAKLDLSTVGPTTGGTNLLLTASVPGVNALLWQTGDVQSGYYLLRLADTGDVTLGPLPASATHYADSPPSADRIDCYADLPVNGTTVLGVSDLLCRVQGIQTGTPPVGFSIQLDQSRTATLSWLTTPGGGPADGYILGSLDLAQPGAQWVTTSLPASAAGDAINVGADFTCFVLIAQFSSTVFANTDVLCADPGVATLTSGPTTSLQAATTQQAQTAVIQRVRAAVTHLPTRQQVRTAIERVVAHRPTEGGRAGRPR